MFIIYLYFILTKYNVIEALRWNSSGYSNNMDSVISLEMTLTEPKIDIHLEEIIIIKDLYVYRKPIVIYCFIEGYSDQSYILYSFCKDQNCLGPYLDGMDYPKVTFHHLTISMDTRFLNRKGIKLEILLPFGEEDSSGSFYCKATDNVEKITIRSNNIQIRDTMFWEQSVVLNTDNLKTIYNKTVSRRDLPITFPCIPTGVLLDPSRPEWIFQELPSPVSWSICPVLKGYETLPLTDKATFSKCVKFTSLDNRIPPSDISAMKKWKYYVNQKGELTILDIDIESKPSDVSYSLMCYATRFQRVQPINTYISKYIEDDIVSGVIFDGTHSSYDRPLRPISPLLQYISLYRRKLPKLSRTNQTVAIYAKYSSSSNASAVWFYQGSPLHNGDTRIINRYSVTFIGNITSEISGNYTLYVHDRGITLTMTIIVTVLGPPILKDADCLPLVRHVWELDSTSFICTYIGRPEELKVQINDQEFKLDDLNKSTIRNLQQNYPYLAQLHFTITPTKFVAANTVTVTYSVYHLRLSRTEIKYQDHTVTFFAKNNHGLSVRSSSIYIVPKVKGRIKEFPNFFNCTTECSSSKAHHFRCRLRGKRYTNIELKVDHYWTINGYRLGQPATTDNPFAPYFTVDPKKKDLTLLPIRSNDTDRDAFVKESLKSNFIICHIDITSSDKSASSFNYSSSSDPYLHDVLKARITIDVRPSSIAIILGITIASVALLLISGILLYCRINNGGEMVHLEKLELEDSQTKAYIDENSQSYFPSRYLIGLHKSGEEPSLT